MLADRLELAGFMHTYDLHDALSAGAIDLKKDYGIAIGYAINLRRVLSEVVTETGRKGGVQRLRKEVRAAEEGLRAEKEHALPALTDPGCTDPGSTAGFLAYGLNRALPEQKGASVPPVWRDPPPLPRGQRHPPPLPPGQRAQVQGETPYLLYQISHSLEGVVHR